ncbi:MAG: M6 family metalloprotease domain-containing protein [Planctomycetota bacterium]|jgi:M6 family metalloprotease-like protein
MKRGCIGLLLISLVGAEEVALDEFDRGASYVVSLPKGYTKDRAWPLILDFHGAIAPSRKGAVVTRDRLWSKLVQELPYIVVGLNGRTRAWGMTRGEKNDIAFALHVLEEVRQKYNVEAARIYLAGFSSGSDWLCKSNVQLKGPFAGSLVTCPGPPNVVGLRGGELVRAKDHPFYFVTGEEDYIRKAGAWEAFLALEKLGARTMYREVPKKGHEFFGIEEYARLLPYLEGMAAKRDPAEDLRVARAAMKRGDYLMASSHLRRVDGKDAQSMLVELEAAAKRELGKAAAVNAALEPGRAYEAWWRVRTQFHHVPEVASAAQKRLDELMDTIGNRELLRARRLWFRTRDQRANRKPGDLWGFDAYLDYEGLTKHVKDLAKHDSVNLVSIGKSVQGRDIWALEIGKPGERPAAFLMGGIHGNEASAVMVALYVAWEFALNPQQRRSVDRLRRNTTLYVVPSANPDALHHYLNGSYSHWRPRYNFRPHDADKDGKIDEDDVEDLDGDGEIGLMYRKDPKGRYALADGRLKPGKPGGWSQVAYEGIDNDGDGKFQEDPKGGVDLNRNFPVGHRPRDRFKGSSGTKPLSEPESKAIADFVKSHDDIALFLDVHNAANCVFFWRPEGTDAKLHAAIASRGQKALGYAPRPLMHEGAGLAIAWAYGELARTALLIELEVPPKSAWGEDGFIQAKPFKHPQLGDILIGNEFKKLAKRNPPPRGIARLAERNWAWLREEFAGLPRLELTGTRIAWDGKSFAVTGTVTNTGNLPTDTARATALGIAVPVLVEAEGASGAVELDTLAPGASMDFAVILSNPEPSVTLKIHHPRAGTLRLALRRPRQATIPIRREYRIEEGYATPDTATRATTRFYKDGKTDKERGPAFKLTHTGDELKIAVLLGEWKDYRHTVQKASFEQALFTGNGYTDRSPTGQNVYGSLRDFYDEMSYGRMKVSGRVFDWVTLPGTRQEMVKASFGSPVVQRELWKAVLARDGADALDSFDGYAFIWAGNAVKRTSALWPMRLKLKEAPGKAAFKMGEYHLGEFAAIGVACHEMGHTFGVNDKYGLGATKNPLGPWCLMGKGTHGSEPSGRHRPFHMCAWCKMCIGWVRPTVIDPATPQKLALRPVLLGPGESYRILLQPDGSEYLLLENRRREGFFTDLPSPGLAVLRVGPNTNPTFPQTRVQLLTAHGEPPARRGVITKPERVAWPQEGKTELTVGSVRLSNIRLVDDVVYFEVGRAD